VATSPLLAWQIRALADNGIEEIGLALSSRSAGPVKRHLRAQNGSLPKVRCAVDVVPRGPAGALKLLEDFVAGEPFLVVERGTFLGSLDLSGLLGAHLENGALATLGTLPAPGSGDARRAPAPAGVYVFDPTILGRIPDQGYFDIKEQLIPRLLDENARVLRAEIAGFCRPVASLQDYFSLQREVLDAGAFVRTGLRQTGDRVWTGEGSRVSPSARITGPVVIGMDCAIEDDARITGPAVIGDGCRVGRSGLVRNGILLDGATLGEGAQVEDSVVGRRSRVDGGRHLRRSVLASDGTSIAITPAMLEHAFTSPTWSGASAPPRGGEVVRRFVKRAMDVVLAAAGIVLAGPLFLACAVAIRLDSRGPALFRARRCGKDGRAFRLLKFRTMVDGAHRRQHELASRSDVDGPVFKVYEDPRVTFVGRFLRRSSLDELPQLFNVLAGDMSLVGPRPLAANEMRFCPGWRDRRLSVKPGLTGLWQVNGRSSTSFQDWIRYDLEYVERQSTWLDAKIILKTALVVLRGHGAY
jgi:lipopolysaccharide/colanic/teichoic acid biosynthesis glycosyltransferase/dTDP-glucose pyrophosphorylase